VGPSLTKDTISGTVFLKGRRGRGRRKRRGSRKRRQKGRGAAQFSPELK